MEYRRECGRKKKIRKRFELTVNYKNFKNVWTLLCILLLVDSTSYEIRIYPSPARYALESFVTTTLLMILCVSLNFLLVFEFVSVSFGLLHCSAAAIDLHGF
jgi:hypothetical protein